MREIKFRAWDKELKEYININNIAIDPTNGDVIELGGYELLDVIHFAVLEQYTGIKDKNGVDIYEGDYIRTKSNIYEVEWFNTAFWAIPDSGHGSSQPISRLYEYEDGTAYRIEVVGNIHEDIDLLEEQSWNTRKTNKGKTMMIVESYKGFNIYWEFIEGTNGFADSEVYTSSAT